MNPIQKCADELTARGYSKSEMQASRQRILNEHRYWKHRFQSHIDSLLIHADEFSPDQIIHTAERLMDLEQAVIERRFPDIPNLESEE